MKSLLLILALLISFQVKAANFTETDSGSLDTIDGLATDGVGGYFQSNSNYGLMGTSAYGTSLWASPQVSSNTSPTVVIQSIGGSSDQLQVQDINGNPELAVHDDGGLQLNIQGSVRPSCNSAVEGLLSYQKHTGSADGNFKVCACNHLAVCSWQ